MSRTTNQRLTYSMIITLLAALGVLALPVAQPAVAAPAMNAAESEQTVDIVHMRDGRELHGVVIEERRDLIIFRRIDFDTGIESTLTLFKRDISEIERDVPVEGQADPTPDETPVPRSEPREVRERVRGLAEGDPNDESLPSLLVVPMVGQMGTDIHPDIYREIVDGIRAMNPDVIVWRMKCGVREDLFAPLLEQMTQQHREEEGIPMFTDEYRELVRVLQDGLSEYEQVMWIEDSHGISSLVALAWGDIYMTPDARLGGLETLYQLVQGFRDADVRAKMLAGMMGMADGFLVRGNHDSAIGVAMIRPDRRLSATWRGREVDWRLDTSGQYLVQGSDENVASFTARTAENLLISNGTAETIDDLALLLGFREYRRLHGQPQEAIENYVEDWRRVLSNAEQWWKDFQQHQGWAQGGDTRYLSRARSDLQRVIRALRRYHAVEIRFMMHYGVNLERLEVLDEQLGDAIRRGAGGGGRTPAGGSPRRPGGGSPY